MSAAARTGGRVARLLGLPVVLVALAWVATDAWGGFFVPPLREVLAVAPTAWSPEVWAQHVWPSLARLAAGFGLAAVAALVAGTVIGASPRLEAVLEPALTFLRALPAPALVPIFLVAFGVGPGTKIATIAVGATWPMLLTTIDGVRAVPAVQTETARVLHLSRWRRYRLLARAASPQYVSGARQSLAIAVVLMVVGEMLMSTDGLGHMVVRFQRTFALPEMWSGVLLVGVLGAALSGLLTLAGRRVLRWHTAMNAPEGASR